MSTPEDIQDLLVRLSDAVIASTAATTALAGSQSNFLRAANGADANIATSLDTPLLDSEQVEARAIDNTVSDKHRNGRPASKRDTRPAMPADFVYSADDTGYDSDDPRHGTDWGDGDDEWEQDRVDSLQIWHRTRGRTIQALINTLPADGYMNPCSSPVAAQRQYKAHPLTLKLSLIHI